MDEIVEFDFISQSNRKSSEANTETTVLGTPTFTAHLKKKLETRLPTITSNVSIINERSTRKDKYGLDQKSKSIDNSCLKSNSSLTKKRKVSLLRFSDELVDNESFGGGNGGGDAASRVERGGSIMRKKKYSLTPEHYKNLNFHHVETVVQTSLQPIKIKTVTSSPNCEFSTKILKPNDYFFLSIFTSLFCCFPIGE